MKTKAYSSPSRRYTAGSHSFSRSGESYYRGHRRRRRRLAATMEFDRIPEIVLPELLAYRRGYGLTAAEIEADLFYGRD